MDVQHVEASRGGLWERRVKPPGSHSALLMCGCFVCKVWGGKGRPSHDNTSVVLSLVWEFQPGVQFIFYLFLLCVKEKSPRLLRNEVSDNVPEFSGPFFVVLINSFLFFQTLCGVLLPVCPEFDLFVGLSSLPQACG